MDDAFAKLEADYCPPLDPALLSAIVSDYDLSDANSVQNARETLDQLKESAVVEEAAGFDPSGTGAHEDGKNSEQRAESCPETGTSQTRETDLTSVSNGMSSLDLDDMVGEESGSVGNPEELEQLDEDTKVKLLQDLFGDKVTNFSIRHTLRKCNGRWQASMEELLNHVYFEEAEDSDGSGKIATKGIDAFAGDGTVRRGRKGKPKGKNMKGLDDRKATSLPTSPASHSPAPVGNRWKTASEDIEFVASRTRIATPTVSSVYYEKGASVPKTIGTLLKATMEESKAIVTDDEAVLNSARELGYEFPGIAPDYLAAIIRLTHPSTTAAHELAVALTTKPKDVNGGGIQLLPHYAPPSLDEEVAWEPVAKTTRSAAAVRSPALDDPAASSRASAYASARATAYAQASAAHRKARSNRLMGGVAAYYGQVGREYAALSSEATAAAADDLASSQSSSAQLDLHGVDVLNAVRIAQNKVEEWWDGLGESRVNGRLGAEDRQMGYRIIVGLGRHSEGGKGKLGPAVSKVLREGGWKVENAGAAIVVKGKARR
ncbi:hypothetical protein D0865_04599 [Hortaea werneckii]|uniref:Smr domain-containing protein n=1 Tax=Hortaea werneckii TaxID=91943 RepID=A0A3M7CSL4_HORWE|nr:hypothetical protein D0865_04599 [Hortaea werneckii]